jgi:hypothetical protein
MQFIYGTEPTSRAFQQAISLGGACMVSSNLLRKFDGLVRSPFDWTITPYFSMLHIRVSRGMPIGQAHPFYTM